MIKYEAQPGMNIYAAATNAVQVAARRQEAVLLFFNGIETRVYPDSNARDIAEKYTLQHELRSVLENH